MTVNKLTLPSKDNAVQSKINEIIDNLGGSNVFIATYGTTTYSDVLTAYNAGKFIYAVESTQYMDALYILMVHNLGPVSGLENFRFINVSGTSNILAVLQYDNTWGKTTANLMSNTATGSNSLTILGSATSESASINIGSSSTATRSNSVAIGNSANTVSQYSVAIGYNAKAGTSSDSSNGAVAIGYNAGGDYSKGNTVAIGNNAVAKSTGSIAIGDNAEVGNTNYTNGIAIGEGSQVYGANSINLGYGANVTANTLSVGFYGENSNNPYTLLDGTTGLIPNARLNIATSSTLGIVKPDSSTITVDANGVISATPARNIGETVHSLVPLTDAGLHLLDGSLISGSGSYADFVTYIAGLVSTYPDLFVTEAAWQQSVTTYGVCGKFVYDSVNNTIRLPKITGIIEGTVDATALGDLVQAGLPNITGQISGLLKHNLFQGIGAFSSSELSGSVLSAYIAGSGNYQSTIQTTSIDASRSSSIYGNSTTVQPQTIKAFIYIVIATNTKTEIEVDIDEIATDLNGKADTDLSNVTTITNSLTSTAINPLINKLTNADITVAPSADIDTAFSIQDVNNIELAKFGGQRYTNGTQTAYIAAGNSISGTRKIAYFNVYVDSSGNDFTDASAGVKSTIVGWGMPDYGNQIVGSYPSYGSWVRVTKDSFVCIWGSDPYDENYWVYVSPDNGTNTYVVGRRADDQNGYTQTTSFTFFVPKNWWFLCQAEGGGEYRIYPLKGAS